MPYTLSPTDLLLSKLQIVELNDKDLDDILRLLVHFPLVAGDGGDGIELGVIGALVGDDWGWFKTISLNLERISARLAEGVPRGDRRWGARSRRGRGDAPVDARGRPEEPALEVARQGR